MHRARVLFPLPGAPEPSCWGCEWGLGWGCPSWKVTLVSAAARSRQESHPEPGWCKGWAFSEGLPAIHVGLFGVLGASLCRTG